MSILSRRQLQHIIEENSAFLSTSQTQKFVRMLNRNDATSLSYEWEIILLNLFSKLGVVEHEKSFGLGRKPDVYFRSANKYMFELIADVTTVSDIDQIKNNPFEYILDQFSNLAKKYNVAMSGFSFEVGGKNIGAYNNSKMMLNLPKKAAIPQYIKKTFTSLISSIKNNPLTPVTFEPESQGVKIKVTYNPKTQYIVGSHPSYKVPYSLTRNPLYNQMKDKAVQLKASEFDGIQGILLCDGSCEIFSLEGHSPTHFSQSQIVNNFFRRNTSVSFVLLFTVKETPFSSIAKQRRFFQITPFLNPVARHPVTHSFIPFLDEFYRLFPIPQRTPRNALYRFKSKNRNKGLSFYGGSSMTEREIKLSSRSIVELLAGKVDQRKFLEDHRLVPSKSHPDAPSFFLRQLTEGRMIKEVRIERCSDVDDDWIVLTFGEPDPAISPFKEGRSGGNTRD